MLLVLCIIISPMLHTKFCVSNIGLHLHGDEEMFWKKELDIVRELLELNNLLKFKDPVSVINS